VSHKAGCCIEVPNEYTELARIDRLAAADVIESTTPVLERPPNIDRRKNTLYRHGCCMEVL